MSNSELSRAGNRGIGDVKDLLLYIGNRPWPSVVEHASINDAVEALSQSSYSHIVYVTDETQILQGVVTEEALVKYLFIHYHDDMVDTRALISRALSEHASDLMGNERLKASSDDDLDYILEEMITCKTDEVPVLDADGRMIGDITMKDIIRYHRHLERESLGI
ncbi:HPP family protein [Alkalimarinus sediminis]|uniref:CBS domain-containing protein n=1 Tax=Alkalimarinus sediminis TaxID=1632866 RepID=A0A9E8KJN4_9ALTE|nr:CBS domain-containing protein [Alkalimarinus sediminis]UZW75231.1 CBS domain-containing protein [Alkalimarinus sediminis]